MITKTAVPEAVRQLRAAIKASGLSASAYARTVLIRSPRTLRRWVAGTSPIPEAVREFLAGQSLRGTVARKPHHLHQR